MLFFFDGSPLLPPHTFTIVTASGSQTPPQPKTPTSSVVPNSSTWTSLPIRPPASPTPAESPSSVAATCNKPPSLEDEEDSEDDGDSPMNDSDAMSTVSLDPEAFELIEEDGRLYQDPDMNPLPIDQRELARMATQHLLCLLALGGKLVTCPTEDAKRVLDLGTGNGDWAIQFADEHPHSTVVGVDMSPVQPLWIPPNCRFEIDDIGQEWSWRSEFNLVFARNLAGCIQDPQTLIYQAYSILEPGGYLEMQELDYTVRCDDGTLKFSSPLFQWSILNDMAAKNIGHPTDYAPYLHQMFLDAGFVDIRVIVKELPTNCWPRDEVLKEMGHLNVCSLGNELDSISLARFKRGLGWSREETIVLCAKARRDFCDPRIHAYFRFYVVSGRKPTLPTSPSPLPYALA